METELHIFPTQREADFTQRRSAGSHNDKYVGPGAMLAGQRFDRIVLHNVFRGCRTYKQWQRITDWLATTVIVKMQKHTELICL